MFFKKFWEIVLVFGKSQDPCRGHCVEPRRLLTFWTNSGLRRVNSESQPFIVYLNHLRSFGTTTVYNSLPHNKLPHIHILNMHESRVQLCGVRKQVCTSLKISTGDSDVWPRVRTITFAQLHQNLHVWILASVIFKSHQVMPNCSQQWEHLLHANAPEPALKVFYTDVERRWVILRQVLWRRHAEGIWKSVFKCISRIPLSFYVSVPSDLSI